MKFELARSACIVTLLGAAIAAPSPPEVKRTDTGKIFFIFSSLIILAKRLI